MITAVAVQSYATGRAIQLDAAQLWAFTREFNRIIRRRSGTSAIPRIAADCKITVFEKRKRRVYELYGRTVLVDLSSGAHRQFYFGLLLLEWL